MILLPALLRRLSPRGLARLALAVLFVCSAGGVVLLVQSLGDARLSRERVAAAGVREHIDRQHTALLQVALHAARLSAVHAALLAPPQRRGSPVGTDRAGLYDEAGRLSAELRGAAAQAQDLDGLLEPVLHGAGQPDLATLQDAHTRWQQAREGVWSRGELLLRLTEQPGLPDLPAAAAQLQEQLDAARVATQALGRALQDNAQRRLESARPAVALWTAGLLLVLGLMALAVLEPMARMLQARERLRQEQAMEMQRLALVAEHTRTVVIITDREDRIQWANQAFVHMTGWTLEEARGQLPRELLHRGSGPGPDAAVLEEAVARGQGARIEAPMRTRDGTLVWLDVDLRPLLAADGTVSGFVSVSTDITDRMRQRQKLVALWAALPVGVVVHDERGRVADANRAAERLLGLSLAQLQGRDPVDPAWRALRADGTPCPAEDHPALRALRQGCALSNELMGVQLHDGEVRWLQVNAEPQVDGPGQVSGVVTCFGDVTESRHLQERLHTSARTDALTTLPNRAEVMDRLKLAIDHAQRHPGYGFAVLFMDFDRFKQVNDTLGHAAGDELLRQISERLRQALRPGDALARVNSRMHVAARIGGDEFVVVLDGLHQIDDVLGVANRLLADLCLPYTVNGQTVQSSASIGIVLSDGQPATAEEVLRNADTAMYEAKRAGRGRCVVFDRSMHERVVHALGVEADLRTALRDDQIFVVYQPVVDLADNRLLGVEALVRWRHPVRGLVPPLEFVGIAEECGLIDAVGGRVLQLACAQFMLWQAELGPRAPQRLAVNLSRAQLKRVDLVEEVRRLLQTSGMPPQQLQLEITETLAAQDERIQNTLRELKALGVGLALDDFGTGYSSLACLHQMPVDTVKIDRSFVRHAETVEYHRVLIEATIRVARTLGMQTVAEGIETEGQATLMSQLHCDHGQGWLYGHAMTAGELLRWVHGGGAGPVRAGALEAAEAVTVAESAAD